MTAKATTSLGRCPTCHRRYKRSSEANRRLWALYAAMSDKLNPKGAPCSPKAYHLWFKRHLLGATDVRLPDGTIESVPNSTADLDVDEFNDYMARVEAMAAEKGVWLDE